ncbi:aminotransferase class I/II-fold pyridoxal phosphate-dependent enzyme [Aquirufa nivalisilvae]|uniref:O-succinylhomoserine sulfhydrylase n=1 Tax=Aquirufa nivalisilvae TaxID=2516557 RepID=A0A2S2DW01_9BACT|nr:aminotransferase class I/II-fold pyridoxal phosphate-dependent enzyme [Aquirufa nivalisilvae]AWL09604.1 O-acetylhomoserine (thiol)-lyase [Aquirufa nivalisilvae]MCZ2483732.1 aminotransferase class I/II-fold pyridoxal phosphate-dependent enzyme [Aquirufa nivalisilvae]TBH74073.1 aminotransferase class I/II-fold pyridoxal phosphate-dependent enzyme [Aquirufa nivalisilvae]
MKKQTQAIRIQAKRSHNREHSVPLYLTSSFTFEDSEQGRAIFAEEIPGNIYSRYQNPNVDEFVEKMCMLENAEAGLAFSTGMAAIFSSLAGLLKQGDHVIASNALFGSAIQILTKITAKWGIECTFVDGHDIKAWEAAIKDNTKFFFCESPSNPGLDLIDIAELAALKKGKDIVLAVDNCFATPILQTPLDLGADLVLHSATKYIDGQGRVLGGVVCGKAEYIAEIRFFARHTGPSLSPFNAWILSKSLELLDLRMQKHAENALALAEALQGHPAVQAVKYPFLKSHPQYELAKKQMKYGGGILTLDIKGGFEKVQKLSQLLQIVSISPNLGDTRTILTHPASTTHSKLSAEDRAAVGITDGLVRVAVGLEAIEDLKEDFLNALNQL